MSKKTMSLCMAALLVLGLSALAEASRPTDSVALAEPGAAATSSTWQDRCPSPAASLLQNEAPEPVLESCWPAECSSASDCGDPDIWKCWAKCCVPK